MVLGLSQINRTRCLWDIQVQPSARQSDLWVQSDEVETGVMAGSHHSKGEWITGKGYRRISCKSVTKDKILAGKYLMDKWTKIINRSTLMVLGKIKYVTSQ